MTDRVRRVQAVLELYLDMHDANFEGGEIALVGVYDFQELFETAELFSCVFPEQPGGDDGARFSRRGLREITRFGHLAALRPIFDKHQVTDRDVADFNAAELNIAGCQQTRERLHEKWSRNKGRDFTPEDCRSYVEVLGEVVNHRQLAAHVTLTNHVRLHRLMMAVLGRLADFSGRGSAIFTSSPLP